VVEQVAYRDHAEVTHVEGLLHKQATQYAFLQSLEQFERLVDAHQGNLLRASRLP